jgi:(E)-4-hydroxy-3-methylbut-2-enyl-diphosphate synthase
VAEVVMAAKDKQLPIRIGVNAGSLERQFAKQVDEGKLTLPQAMVQSALFHIGTLEEHDFYDIKISLKASDVLNTVEAYRQLARECEYPFHVGITEAGTQRQGTIKSAVGIGALAMEGLCDTIRVSLCTEPPEEIYVGKQILQSIGLSKSVGDVIACPTCGRLEIDMLPMTDQVEELLGKLKVPIKVAIMGCAVNGPGEAKGAHIGIAAGRNQGALYRDGELVKKLTEPEIVPTLLQEIEEWAEEYKRNNPDAEEQPGSLMNLGEEKVVAPA